ncbi:hypothetical protein [Bacillus thermotolerans]|uniref:Yip1 domain-containing protein n=1 Tax=Bacillus thermotolerans TaxID=1221996 RepID=A0A0F5I7P8_BACTR|nr:hypothetical protein [Bacillus thermotolerans]KKB36150.1 hypothetical protein QY97_01242 [Bacillus thermotolerans]KKB41197.1 hypothetical protein QY95_00904 [Bacillus thermotolerans]KKB44058.1 hypothetical protein QY96_03684 [Bacillus thermotolerans]
MIYRVQLVKGLLHPRRSLEQLEHAEKLKGLWGRIFLVVFLSTLIYFLGGLLGFQSESVSTYLPKSGTLLFEHEKMLFAAGQAIWGFLFPLLIIFLPSLVFWTFLEVDFSKLFTLQSMVYVIYLIEYVLLILFNIALAIPRDSSPFSLGVIAQYISENEIVTSFFSFVTLFQVWAITLQYRFLKRVSSKQPTVVLTYVGVVALAMWLFSALFTSIHIDRLFQ